MNITEKVGGEPGVYRIRREKWRKSPWLREKCQKFVSLDDTKTADL